MNKIYFFTDQDLLGNQVSGQQFGCESDNIYNLSSLHSVTGSITPRAIAITEGLVAIQQIEGAGNENYVNVILKPLKPVTQITALNFAPIQYFIYRKVLKNSIIDDTASPSVIGDYTQAMFANDLTKRLRKIQDKINEETDKRNGTPPGSTKTPPSPELLGYDLSLADTDKLEKLFIKPSGNLFQVPNVRGGEHIGDFDHNDFGLEIIFDEIRTKPLIEITRKLKNSIDVSAMPATSEPEKFAVKTKKEEILGYMDTAAFYGSLVNHGDGVGYKKSGSATEYFSITENIYTDLLKNKFLNHNTLYIDIRNEYNNSFNYFGNYGDNLIIAIGSDDSGAIQDYYNFDNCKWPVLAIRTASLYDPADNQGNVNAVSIRLPYASENPDPYIFISQGYTNFPTNLIEQNKFAAVSRIPDENYLSELRLEFPNKSNSGSTIPIAFYCHLKYLKTTDVAVGATPNRTHHRLLPLDNVFMPLAFNLPPHENTYIEVKTYEEEAFVLMNGKEFVATIGMAIDDNNVTFFGYPVEKSPRDKFSKTFPLSVVDQKTKGAHFIELLDNDFESNKLKHTLLNITGLSGNVSVLQFQYTGSVPAFRYSRLDRDFFAVILNKVGWEGVITAIPSSMDKNKDIYLAFSDANPAPGTPEFDTLNSTPFRRFEIVLKGYNSNTFEIENFPTGKIVFGYGHDDSLILVDSASVLPPNPNPGASAVSCPTLPELTLGTLIGGVRVGGLQSFINAINSGVSVNHAATQTLVQNVFRNVSGTMTPRVTINPSGDILYDGTPILSNPAWLPRPDWLAEACTIFVLWRFQQHLAYLVANPAATPTPPIFNRLKRMLQDMGFTNATDADFIFILNPDRPMGLNTNWGLADWQNLSLLNGILYILSFGNFNAPPSLNNISTLPPKYTGGWRGGGASPTDGRLTKARNQATDTASQIIKTLQNAVQEEITCLYKYLSTDAPPAGILLASGNGSETEGLLGLPNNVGILLFDYATNDRSPSRISESRTRPFAPRAGLTSVHFNLFGVNPGIEKTININVNFNGDNFAFEARIFNTFPVNNLLPYPVSNTTTVSPPIPTGFRNGGIPLGATTYRFLNAAGLTRATFDVANLTLTFTTVSSSPITVRLWAGNEEVFIAVNIIDAQTPVTIVPPNLTNLFGSDQFVLIHPDDLLDPSINPGYADSLDPLIDILLSINPGNIFLDLKVGFVGEVDPTYTVGASTSRIRPDPDYSFILPRAQRYPELARVADFQLLFGDMGKTLLTSENEKELRYSYVSFQVIPDLVKIEVVSFCSPVWSRLDKNTSIGSAKKPALDLFTRYGIDSSDDTYVVTPDGKRPSYNPVLCALRSFGITEAIKANIVKRAADTGKTLAEQDVLNNKMQAALDNTVVYANYDIGIVKDLRYADYVFFK